MYVWSKRLTIGVLTAFVLVIAVFLTQGQSGEESVLNKLTTGWSTVDYVGLVLWVFVWMIDADCLQSDLVVIAKIYYFFNTHFS